MSQKTVPVGFGLVTIGSEILDGRIQDSHFETTRSIANGHFLPGFPSMAEPMTAWVLDTYCERGNNRFTRTLVVQGAREADLLPLMEKFIEEHPAVTLSSLPRFVECGSEVHLGRSAEQNACVHLPAL